MKSLSAARVYSHADRCRYGLFLEPDLLKGDTLRRAGPTLVSKISPAGQLAWFVLRDYAAIRQETQTEDIGSLYEGVVAHSPVDLIENGETSHPKAVYYLSDRMTKAYDLCKNPSRTVVAMVRDVSITRDLDLLILLLSFEPPSD